MLRIEASLRPASMICRCNITKTDLARKVREIEADRQTGAYRGEPVVVHEPLELERLFSETKEFVFEFGNHFGRQLASI